MAMQMDISAVKRTISEKSSSINIAKCQFQCQYSVDLATNIVEPTQKSIQHTRECSFSIKKSEDSLTSNQSSMHHQGQKRVNQYKCPFCNKFIFAAHRLQANYPRVTCPYCARNSCSYCKVASHGMSCFEFSGHGPTYVLKPSVNDLLTKGECQTCLITKASWKRPCCGIRMCLPCLKIYISGKVDEGVIDVICPGHPCSILLDPGLIKQIIDKIKSKRLGFLRIKANRYKFKKACPFCDYILCMDQEVLDYYNNSESIVVCPGCKEEWCVHCMAPWHEGMSCGEYRSSTTKRGIDKWALRKQKNGDRNAQKCPNCKVRFLSNIIYSHSKCQGDYMFHDNFIPRATSRTPLIENQVNAYFKDSNRRN